MKQNNLLNRKTYKKIKKMDKQEMENFVGNVYTQGYQDGWKEGSEASQEIDYQIELVQFLQQLNVKGIGPKTKDKIIKAYRERVKKE